jgi:RecA-family ATPase
MKYRASDPSKNGPLIIKWVRDFIERGAPEGERNERLYAVAQQWFWDKVPIDQAENFLAPIAIKCGLGPGEISQTIKSAYQSKPGRPLSGIPSPPGCSAGWHPPHQPPPPPHDDFLRLIAAAFAPDELVAICEARENSDGELKPGPASIHTRAEWEEMHRASPVGKRLKTPGGTFICLNPLISRAARRTLDNIAAYRHVLAEFDQGTQADQRAKLENCGLPVTAIVSSGNRGLHGWIRVDARSREEWNARRDHIFKLLGCDPKNKDPTRLSRLAGVTRLVDGVERTQELIATHLGPDRWPDVEGLPDIIHLGQLLDKPQEIPQPLIKGLLYRGCKMVLGSSSKGRKSWVLIDLGMSCASGRPWLGFPVIKGRVLYVNFEMTEWMLIERMQKIADDRGLPLQSIRENFDVLNLRGFAADFSTLIPQIITKIKVRSAPYSLIILDPIYKGLGERDENKAGDINDLWNKLEHLCLKTGAALVVCHHFAKSDPWEKEPMDRLSGSGVFGRDPDSLVILTPGHFPKTKNDKSEGVITTRQDKETLLFVDIILRASPPIPPFRLRWNHCHFEREDAQKHVLTYKTGSRADKYGPILEMMPRLPRTATSSGEGMDTCMVIQWIAENCNLPPPEALKTFHILRQSSYRFIAHEGAGIYVGTKFRKLNP